MRAATILGVSVLAAAAAAPMDETPAQVLFDQVRKQVLTNIARVPRYTCVETMTRVVYRPQYNGARPSTCTDLAAARSRLASPGLLVWHDRLRLDVAVGKDGEMFGWAGDSSFESGAMNDLAASGATGSGAFSSFLSSVFGRDAEKFRYTGEHDMTFGHLAAFEFEVPEAKSHYQYTTGTKGNEKRIIGYHGSFYVVPATAAIRRLEVVADQFPPGEACRVVDTMDYTTVKIGSGDFLLPEVSTMDVLYPSGDEAKNVTRFSGCREYVGESKIIFDDPGDATSPAAEARAALKALPSKTRIRVKIDPPLSSETAAAGDPITGVVEHEVKEKGQVLVRTTDKLRGRILQMEQDMLPAPHWTVTIRFDSIERDGVTEPVRLKAVDDGDRRTAAIAYGGRRFSPPPPVPAEPPKRPVGAGIFILPMVGNLTLDQKFHSEWETR